MQPVTAYAPEVPEAIAVTVHALLHPRPTQRGFSAASLTSHLKELYFDILRRSDFVCLEYDYNPSTHKMIGEREFALMKPTAYFINTARGRIVDEPALVRALQNRTIAGAGLDVFWHEPPGSPEMAPSEEFFKMDNVILAPHNGGATWDARTELTKATARQIVTLIGGGRPEGLVLD